MRMTHKMRERMEVFPLPDAPIRRIYESGSFFDTLEVLLRARLFLHYRLVGGGCGGRMKNTGTSRARKF